MWKSVFILLSVVAGGELVYGAISTCYRDNHGWQFDKYCLEIVLPQKTWYSARNYCANRGGDLVEVRTPQMQNSISSHLRIYNGRYNGFWIGASDSESEGWWRWLHNPRGMSWSYWSPGEGPNHGFLFGGYPDDCALIRVDQNFRWYDSPCDGVVDALHYSFICQYVMEPPTTTVTTPKPTTTPKTTTITTTKPTTTTTTPLPTTTSTTSKSTTTSTTPKSTTTTTTPKPTTKTTTPMPTTTSTTPKSTTTTTTLKPTTSKPTTTSVPTTTIKPTETATTPKPSLPTTEQIEISTIAPEPTECLEPSGCVKEPTEFPEEKTTTQSIGVIIG